VQLRIVRYSTVYREDLIEGSTVLYLMERRRIYKQVRINPEFNGSYFVSNQKIAKVNLLACFAASHRRFLLLTTRSRGKQFRKAIVFAQEKESNRISKMPPKKDRTAERETKRAARKAKRMEERKAFKATLKGLSEEEKKAKKEERKKAKEAEKAKHKEEREKRKAERKARKEAGEADVSSDESVSSASSSDEE